MQLKLVIGRQTAKQGEATTERETWDADEKAEVVGHYRESAGPSEFLIAL